MTDVQDQTVPEPPISTEDIERLRACGLVVVPLAPTSEMQRLGAPTCYQAYDGDWAVALRDAKDCYQAMVECGCLWSWFLYPLKRG